MIDGATTTSDTRSVKRSLLHKGRAWLIAIPVFGPVLERVSRLERWTMIALAISAIALFAFAKLAEEMVQGDTRAFDEYALLALRTSADPSDPIGPTWFEEMMRDFTALGGTGVLVSVTLAVVGFLLITGKRHMALVMAGSVSSGMLLSQALKWGFDRPRPDLVPLATQVYSQSFPSGHAMVSTVTYLTIGMLLARTPIRTAVKGYLLGVAILLTLTIGISRVYLGVHWPSDVLAGWAAGAGWALSCWLAVALLQSRGVVERDGDVTAF